ncbi:protein translocase subunit SecF [Paenibacillus lycopersici]|uniref:Protein-export membrane protein SecF n=1 Tax=Paenibacillus lycopersici TaxID=2704462 RepID=A0A6C0G8B9_9BACL|nr:protein translocase subunit SecF [Paenibacillus lycopersici]QHT64022.1 protein translocase subunit SecF [Paenibacillus lycopersici]
MFAIAITLLGIITLSVFGLKYGVDFKAGSSVDITFKKDIGGEKAAFEQYLKDNSFGSPGITFGAKRVTLRFDDVLTDTKEKALKQGIAEKFDKDASMEVNTVDVEIAKELQRNALKAVLVASVGIAIYVSIRFEWRFAVAAIVKLLHDAFIVISLFSIFRLEVNLPFIVAVLTIIGYSINDTVVIFDRIRENLRFAKLKTVADIANVVDSSIWQTMSRSINTVMTVVFATLCLLIFGSESIRLFSVAILFGLVAGVYSSVFIASPLWFLLKSKQKTKTNVKSSAAS